MNIIKANLKFNGTLTPLKSVKFLVQHHMMHKTWNVKDVHNFHKNGRGWFGIAYNYWISFDGTIYDCRGLNQGGHVKGHNSNTIGIGYQGDFRNQDMTDAQLKAGIELNAYLAKKFNLTSDQVVGHRDIGASDCPSKNFRMKELKEGVAKSLGHGTSSVNIKKEASNNIEVKDMRKLLGVKLTDAQNDFIAEIYPGAKENFEKYNIFPSLIIAQAMLESTWGTSELAVKSNNLFGIKAFSDWSGEFVMHKSPEVISGQRVMIESAFRAYPTRADSIKDHGNFLRYRTRSNGSLRYEQVWKAKDYKQAVIAIHAAGYANDPNYTIKVIGVIEKYNLHKLDEQCWKTQLGKEALEYLADKGFINNPEYWKDKMIEPMETWAVLEFVKRILIERNED